MPCGNGNRQRNESKDEKEGCKETDGEKSLTDFSALLQGSIEETEVESDD